MPKGIYKRTEYHKQISIKSLKYAWGKNIGKKNGNWGGNKINYTSLHQWVRRKLGKAKECIWCHNQENIEWASKSHKAKRDLNDYFELCSKCHYKYDEMGKKAWLTRRKRFGKRGIGKNPWETRRKLYGKSGSKKRLLQK